MRTFKWSLLGALEGLDFVLGLATTLLPENSMSYSIIQS